MSFQNELTKIRDKYSNELSMIFDFVKTTENKLTSDQNLFNSENITSDERTELAAFVKSVLNSEDGIVKVNFDEHPVGHIIKGFHIPTKHKHFLTNMTLGYLITFQEAFLKDYLFQILIHNKNALKSKSKTTYADILKFDSMDELVVFLAQSEADQIGYGSIEDVAKHYDDKFNIKLLDFDTWDIVVESTCRRNILIHNKNKTNEIYCKLTGFTTVGETLDNDIEYIQRVTNNLIAFNNFCFESITEKFKLVSRK